MSLKKIAEITGTSTSTVSRVLNNSYDTCASEELKARIWKAAHEINYVPNSHARNLKQGSLPDQKTLRISVLLARVASLEIDLFFKELYRNLEIAIFQKGFIMNEMISSENMSSADFTQCDGVIILGRCSGQLLEEIEKQNKNIIGIWRNAMNFEIDEIVCDGRKAAETAISYLVRLGHKKIGYIGDCSYENRYVGYTEAMIREHLALDYTHIIPTNQTREEGAKAMKLLLEQGKISAVLCANDMTAIGALETLKAQRKKNRQQISVISIDDIAEAQNTTPLLTTIRVPRADMAHMAVQVLEDRINHGHTEHLRIEFPCRIIERSSCFPCTDN